MKFAVAATLAALIALPAYAERKAITSPDAPAAIGPYVQAVAATGEMVFVSGQIALDPKSGQLVAGDIKAQTAQVFKNLAAVLAAHGLTLDDATMATVYVTDIGQFAAVNEVYATFFKTPPARATVGVAALPRGAAVEIALIAVKGKK
jgi:2-iminobutanoate/2-iminopropanoate deaminase